MLREGAACGHRILATLLPSIDMPGTNTQRGMYVGRMFQWPQKGSTCYDLTFHCQMRRAIYF